MPLASATHGIDTLSLMLTALQHVARVETNSILKRPAEVALNIHTVAQEAKMHGEFLRLLANNAFCLVYQLSTFVEQMKEQDVTLPVDFANSVKDLLKVLKEIEAFINKPQTLFTRLRAVVSSSDANRIMGYRQTLDYFWARLGLQSNIIIRDAVAQIAQRQDAILDVLRQESEGRPSQPHVIFMGSINTTTSTITHVSDNQLTSTTSNIVNTNSGNLAAMSHSGTSM